MSYFCIVLLILRFVAPEELPWKWQMTAIHWEHTVAVDGFKPAWRSNRLYYGTYPSGQTR